MPSDKDILIVDDSEESVLFLSEVLEEHEYPFRVARNGNEALDAMKEKKPDLVLLDVMMPRKSGTVVFQHMKKDPNLQDIPIIFITAASEVTGVDMHTGEEKPKEMDADEFMRRFGIALHEQMKSFKPDGYLEKPFDPPRLLEKLKELL